MSRRGLCLLAPDDDELDDSPPSSSKKGSRRRSGKPKMPSSELRVPGFRLRDAQNGEAVPGPSSSARPTSSEVDALAELLGGALPRDIIRDVYQACGSSRDAALDALLAMAAPPPSSNSTPPQPLKPPTERPQRDENLPNLWDLLPEECKALVLAHLSLKDLSRVAGASREFAAYVRLQRRSLRCVSVPAGVSMRALSSLVAAFPAAEAVDLSRCANTLRFPLDFENVAVAIAAGAARRPLASSSFPVRSLSLAKCAAATDGDVAAVLRALPTLRALNVSRCAALGDAVLATMARYRRSPDRNVFEGEDDVFAVQENTPILSTTVAAAAEEGELADGMAGMGLESPAQAVQRLVAAKEAATAQRRACGGAAAAAAAAAGGLEELVASGTDITAKGVTELLRGSGRAPSLLTLDVSRCPRITPEALLPGPNSLLRVLRASGCAALSSLTLQLPVGSALRELTLADCRNLREIVISSAPSLEELNVSGCSALAALTLRCPRLVRLRASGCSNLALGLGGGGGFNGGGNEGGAFFECPELREVNLFGCRALESAGLESILPSLALLQDLDLSGCVGLSRIDVLQAPGLGNLKRLTVDGCRVLRWVAIAAAGLTEFSARSCSRLMELRLVDAMPRVLNLENCAELRELSIGGGGGSSAGRPERGQAGRNEARRRLVLRGCVQLPQRAREDLRARILG